MVALTTTDGNEEVTAAEVPAPQPALRFIVVAVILGRDYGRRPGACEIVEPSLRHTFPAADGGK
ncbi:MAG: hypothetical protein ABI137_06995 [Antricoccus sp.]